MGREIRRVAAGWEHPLMESPNYYCCQRGTCDYPHYQPLFDESFEEAAREWLDNAIAWDKGVHPDQHPDYEFYWQWNGAPPEPKEYRPQWSKEERTHYQMYETVSEGTPVSPVFASLEELSDWIVRELGYSKEQADAFCQQGWAPSFVVTGAGTPQAKMYDAVESASLQNPKK